MSDQGQENDNNAKDLKHVCKSFQDWVVANFDQTELADLCNHGAQAGFHGLLYYSETVALYNQYESNIWDMLYEDCEAQGYNSIPEFIATFSTAGDVGSSDQLKNLLVWYAAERIAFDLTQGEYPNENECNH